MVDLDGNAVGLIAVDAVYDRNGVQLGWWYGDHLRNRNGQVVLFVTRSKIEGLMMPAEKPISRVPTLRLPCCLKTKNINFLNCDHIPVCWQINNDLGLIIHSELRISYFL